MTEGLERLTAAEGLTQVAAGVITATAWTQACLARAAARDEDVRAWAFLDPKIAADQAGTLDEGAAAGSLKGLPVGVKDVIFTHDMPTQFNSEIYEGFHPRLDAACVQILRAAGAVMFGKADTVEFAATGRPARTRNPHNLEHTPGGSSSGSAAAVADFHVPVALGTQTGGSMIRPASYCGVWAMKPTWNLVSAEGCKRFATSLDTVGWFARSAADLALIYDVFDSEPAQQAPLSVAGARIAICRSPVWGKAEPATRAALQAGRDALSAAGAEVVDLDLPASFDDLIDRHRLVMLAEGRSAFLNEYRAHHDQLGQTFRDHVENAEGFSRQDLLEAYDRAASCRREFDEIAHCFDAVVTPSAVGEAPHGLAKTGDYAFNGIWSLLHVPCINVPGFTGPLGLPVGLTVTGPRFADRKVMAAAAAIGRAFGLG
jgi:Asp-tRNA(Asn)/Glu-tRNA(Gln) amidotransferase A subunit family amidase